MFRSDLNAVRSSAVRTTANRRMISKARSTSSTRDDAERPARDIRADYRLPTIAVCSVVQSQRPHPARSLAGVGRHVNNQRHWLVLSNPQASNRIAGTQTEKACQNEKRHFAGDPRQAGRRCNRRNCRDGVGLSRWTARTKRAKYQRTDGADHRPADLTRKAKSFHRQFLTHPRG